MPALAVGKGHFRSRSYSGGDDVRNRLTRARGWAWKLAIPAAALGVAANLGLTGSASATLTGAGGGHHMAGTIAPAESYGNSGVSCAAALDIRS